MNPGIRSAALAALAWGGLATGCRHAADPEQLQAVDRMITDVDAALMTLNELDKGRFDRLDSAFQARAGMFATRFNDTLDRGSADALGNLYLVLRMARTMGNDHDRMLRELTSTGTRLRALRADLANGVLSKEETATAIATERVLFLELEANVHLAIDNYRTAQRTWDELPRADMLLAATHASPVPSGR